MAIELMLTDAVAHAGAGVALALLDYLSSKLANPKDARMARKRQCLQSIDALLDAEEPTPPDSQGEAERRVLPKDSVEYAGHIANVQAFLCSSGLARLQVPLWQRIKSGARSVIADEKINGLSMMQKLFVAIGAEVLYEVVFGFYHATQILKQSPAAAIAANLYQIPAFWFGLWAGGVLKTLINLLVTPYEEKQADRMIRKLLDETNIVNVIVNYRTPETLKTGLAERGLDVSAAQLTRMGQGAFRQLRQFAETAKQATDDVLHYPQKQAEKEQQAQEERRKRFDDLTKGR